jgi:hypothetical protein
VVNRGSNDETESDLCTSVYLQSEQEKGHELVSGKTLGSADVLMNIDAERDLSSCVERDRSAEELTSCGRSIDESPVESLFPSIVSRGSSEERTS